MRFLLICALALGAAVLAADLYFVQPQPAPATPLVLATGGELVWRNGTMTLRLTEQPCAFYEAREPLESEGIPPAKLAFLTQGGRTSVICWARDIDGDVMTLDLAGKEGFVPATWFKTAPMV